MNYIVHGCINCEYFSKDFRTKECQCSNECSDIMRDWINSSGRKKISDFTEDDDLDCFSPNKKTQATIRHRESLSSFMNDLNDMVNNDSL